MELVLGVDVRPEVGTFLGSSGFMFAAVQNPSLDSLYSLPEDTQCAAMVFGTDSNHGCYSVQAMRRERVCIPIIRLAKKPRDENWAIDAATFLDYGGDDVLEEPDVHGQLEIVAASLRAHIRRFRMPLSEIVRYEHGDHCIEIDVGNRRMQADGVPVTLTGHEAETLAVLVEHSGIVTRRDLHNRLYGVEKGRPGNTIEVFITRIRKKLGLAAPIIQTIHGRGYQMQGRVA